MKLKDSVIFIIGVSNGWQYSTIAATGFQGFNQLISPYIRDPGQLAPQPSPMDYIISIGDFTYAMFVIRNLHALAETIEDTWQHGRSSSNRMLIAQVALNIFALISAVPYWGSATNGAHILHIDNWAAANSKLLYSLRILVSIDPAIRFPRRSLEIAAEVREAWHLGNKRYLTCFLVVVLANIGYCIILADDINRTLTLLTPPTELAANNSLYLLLTILGAIGCIPLFFGATLLGLTQLFAQSPLINPYPLLSLGIVLFSTLGPLSRLQPSFRSNFLN